MEWTRKPEKVEAKDGVIAIITKPHTDLWQRTYYHFRNDNAPVLQMKTNERFFSFVVKTIQNHPLIPRDITVRGFIIDSVTGALEEIN